jgi:small-conductance mechanosensitive channel
MGEIIVWLGQYHVNLAALLTSVAVLVVAGLAIAVLKRLLSKWLNSIQPRVQLSIATISTIIRAVTATLWLIAILVILDAWGVVLAGFWSLLVSAIAVIGVGFLATWAMVSNVTASFFLAFWRPFRSGDTVVVLPENTAGRVTDRNLMFTVLREQHGSLVYVPNNLFFQKMFRVINDDDQSSRPEAT